MSAELESVAEYIFGSFSYYLDDEYESDNFQRWIHAEDYADMFVIAKPTRKEDIAFFIRKMVADAEKTKEYEIKNNLKKLLEFKEGA